MPSLSADSSEAIRELLSGINSLSVGEEAVLIWAPLPADAVAAACRRDGKLWMVIDDSKCLSRHHAADLIRTWADELGLVAEPIDSEHRRPQLLLVG